MAPSESLTEKKRFGKDGRRAQKLCKLVKKYRIYFAKHTKTTENWPRFAGGCETK